MITRKEAEAARAASRTETDETKYAAQVALWNAFCIQEQRAMDARDRMKKSLRKQVAVYETYLKLWGG